MERMLRSLSLSVVLLVAAGPAGGAEVYSTFGPGDSYGASNYAIGPVDPNNWAIAAAFSAPEAFTLDSFDLALEGFNGQPIQFAVHEDSAGLPGVVLDSITIPLLQGPVAIVNVDFSALDLVLAADTTYHLSLADPSSTTLIPGGWRLNSQALTGISFSSNGGATWTGGGGTKPTFRVNAVVPEPGSAAALLGVLAVAARRWR